MRRKRLDSADEVLNASLMLKVYEVSEVVPTIIIFSLHVTGACSMGEKRH